MLRMYSHIRIGEYNFNYVQEVATSSAYDTFTDTARIILPSKFRDVNKTIVNNNGVFQRGDEVEIKLGYYPYLTTVFKGYVSKIYPDSPLRIDCEDAAWKLKKQNIGNFTQKNCTLTQLMTHLMGSTGIEFENIDVEIGTFRISNKDYVNIVDCLSELKQNFGLYAWMKDGKLYVGYPFTQQFYTTTDVSLSFQNDIVSSSLEYVITDQLDVVLQGISNKLDDTKITRYCFYDADGNIILSDSPGQGEQRTFNYIELSQTALDAKLREQLPNMIYNGYKGNFTTFGQPIINPLDRVIFTDNKFPEREGKYLVKKVERLFNESGYRQTVELDARVL